MTCLFLRQGTSKDGKEAEVGGEESMKTKQAVLQNLQVACGRAPAAAELAPVDRPFAEAEPDAFPCLLIVAGSAIAFNLVRHHSVTRITRL